MLIKVRIINKPDFIELEKEVNSFIEREKIGEEAEFISIEYQVYPDGSSAPRPSFNRDGGDRRSFDSRDGGDRRSFSKPPMKSKMFSAMLVYKK